VTDYAPFIAQTLKLKATQVKAAVDLLDDGNTIPFIARYRKEQTGELDEVQIRAIGDKFTYYAELETRKLAVMKSIEAQGRMTDDLKAKISGCKQKFILAN